MTISNFAQALATFVLKCIDINNIMLRLDVGFLPDDDGEEEAAEGEV